MRSSDSSILSRRRFLRASLGVGATLLAGCGDGEAGEPTARRLAGGERDGILDWPDDDPPVFGPTLGSGWDGRRYYDLGELAPHTRITPRDAFFLRTLQPDSLAKADAGRAAAEWSIRLEGLAGGDAVLPLASLRPQPMGAVLIECAGNDASARFGLMGCARWEGVPIERVLDRHPAGAGAVAVEVRGVDDHATPSRGGHSTPGAAWIFPRDALVRARAFLATGMNGEPLLADGGAPVRLVVPGWYGCAHVKWVEAIRWVGADAPATAQMREFARRTHQRGVPRHARDYRPATIDAAALPVRVERWRVRGETWLRVVGICWGDAGAAHSLRIRIGSERRWTRIDAAPPQPPGLAWTLWEHAFRPRRAGDHAIECRFADGVRQRRQAAGFHDRIIRI